MLFGGQISGLDAAQTVELWLLPNSANQTAILVATTNDVTGWSLELNNGQITWWMVNSSGGWQAVSHPTTLSPNTWHHVVLTYSGDSARVYVDGVPGSSSVVGIVTVGPQLRVGGFPGYSYFNGEIDELRLSNVVRYTAAFTPPESALGVDANTLALYRFNEGNGQITADLVGASGALSLGATTATGADDPVWVESSAPAQ